MGAWGTSLYANDSASDIRGDYIDKLRRGKSNEEATKELIEENSCIIGDVEEEPLFWFALADTQWNYGRLLPDVKEKALHFLSQNFELERWKETGEKETKAWLKTLNHLKAKLIVEQPALKKISKYRLYSCKWKLGDVFAYKFTSDYSVKKGFFGQYVVFRKVSEDTCWPGHIVPVIQVYKWIGKEIPSVDKVKENGVLELWYLRSTFEKIQNVEHIYISQLYSTSERVIPKDNLFFLGNLPGDDIIPFKGHDVYNGYISIGWEGSKINKTFEKHIIDMYLEWN